MKAERLDKENSLAFTRHKINVCPVIQDLEERLRQAIDKVPPSLDPHKVVYTVSDDIEFDSEGSFGLIQARIYRQRDTNFASVIFYKKAIEFGCKDYTSEEIDKRLYDIVVHELGHLAGFSDEQMRKKWGI